MRDKLVQLILSLCRGGLLKLLPACGRLLHYGFLPQAAFRFQWQYAAGQFIFTYRFIGIACVFRFIGNAYAKQLYGVVICLCSAERKLFYCRPCLGRDYIYNICAYRAACRRGYKPKLIVPQYSGNKLLPFYYSIANFHLGFAVNNLQFGYYSVLSGVKAGRFR